MDTLLSLDWTPVNNIRKQTLNGREFVVADVIMLREGVLNGSKGPLFYPAEEIAANPGIWNGYPVTANHPMMGNQPISATTPESWGKYTIGILFNDRYDEATKTRRVEAWYDVELSNRVDKRIIPSILSGKPINVSTGLFTKDEKLAQNMICPKGKQYGHIARNYKPNHLATLLDDMGACSVRDGCGINLNTLSPEDNMRNQLVSWLTTNCDCYKGKDAVLNDEKMFTEDELKKLKNNQEQHTLVANALAKVSTTLGLASDTKLSELPSLAANALEDMKKAAMKKKGEKDEEEDEDTTKKKPAMNTEDVQNVVANYLKGLGEKERLELIASPTINALIKNGQEITNEKKVEIIKQLTANVTNEADRKAKILKLKDKSLDQLKEILEFATTNATSGDSKTDEEKFLANFYGATGGTNNGGKNTPTYNRADILLPNITANTDEEVETVLE